MTTLQPSSTSPESVTADAVVVGVARGRKGLVLTAPAIPVDQALDRRLLATLAALGASGKPEEVTKVATLGRLRAPVLLVVGLGEEPGRGEPGYPPETLRRAAGAAVRALAGSPRVALALPAADPARVAAVAEGALLGGYAFTRYRQDSAADLRAPVDAVTLLLPDPRLARDRAVKAGLARAQTVTEAVAFCRDLVNTPPSDLHPQELADAATAHARAAGVSVEVLDERALAKGGYGGILGVGQGSAHPPRLVRLGYRHPRAKAHLAFVGKGITFDSGGLSLKPPRGMVTMKCDMGGAAAVAAAVAAVARLRPVVAVTGWAPLAENMPSGTAQRPSDVLTTYGGKTVEVLNTDAEGRLVLADAIARAGEESPDVIVDVATLTGAAMVALGSRYAGVMANDDALRDRVVAAAADCGEAMWPMPLPEELRRSLDSEVADIANIGDRNGGMLVAGLFLREFVPAGRRWAHLDIAGPAFNEGDPFGYTPKGGTGAAVRTLVRLAELAATGEL